jgi:hypothetical protein
MIKPRPCIRCKALIPEERLEALPDTRLCIACSQAVGGDYVVHVRSERTSKPGSLKINYGGAEIIKKRRQIRSLDEENADENS